MKSSVFSFSVKWHSKSLLQIIQQNGFVSLGLPEYINALLGVALFLGGSHVGPFEAHVSDLGLSGQAWPPDLCPL